MDRKKDSETDPLLAQVPSLSVQYTSYHFPGTVTGEGGQGRIGLDQPFPCAVGCPRSGVAKRHTPVGGPGALLTPLTPDPKVFREGLDPHPGRV